MMLWLLHDEGRVIQLIRREDPQIEYLQARIQHLSLSRLEDARRRRSHVLRSCLHQEVADALGPHPFEVLKENPCLISLGHVLIEYVHDTRTPSVRFRFRGVPEDGHQVRPRLCQPEKVAERTGGNFHGGDRSIAADVRDLAGRPPPSRRQKEDRRRFLETPDAPAAFAEGSELAPLGTPSPIFHAPVPLETFAVDGSPWNLIL